jgi:hypothetical protein
MPVDTDVDSLADHYENTLECDYDKNVTNLYEAIEKGAFESVLAFLTTEKWSLLTFTKDVLSPESQARTWVTRFHPNGKVRWSQLPLHAAIIFRAPMNVVKALIDLYPLSVQCTDDQRMLPLHLAIRVGAKDSIMNLLIKCFPNALVTENQHGKVPYAIMGRDVRTNYTESVQQIVKYITRKVTVSQQESSQEKTEDLEDAMDKHSQCVTTLENDNLELKHELSDARVELAIYKERCRMLERMVTDTKSTIVPETITNNASRVISRANIALANTADPKDTGANMRQATNTSMKRSVNFNSRRHHEEPDLLPDTTTKYDSHRISKIKFKLANTFLDPEDSDASACQSTNASTTSSLNLKVNRQLEQTDMCWNFILDDHEKEPDIFLHDDSREISRNKYTVVNTLDSYTKDAGSTMCESTNGSATSSVNLNAVHRESTNNTSATSSVNLNAIHQNEQSDICWNELRHMIRNSTDIALTSETKEKLNSSSPGFIFRESMEKMMELVPKERETRADTETTSRRQKDPPTRKHAFDKSHYASYADPNYTIPEGEEGYMI